MFIREIEASDIVHILFRVGYSANFVRRISGQPMTMELRRHRNNRQGITAVVGNVKENIWEERKLIIFATVPRLANMELRAQAGHSRLDNASAELTVPYKYIGKMEKIESNPDASSEQIFKNPGQVQKGGERYNARSFRKPVII